MQNHPRMDFSDHDVIRIVGSVPPPAAGTMALEEYPPAPLPNYERHILCCRALGLAAVFAVLACIFAFVQVWMRSRFNTPLDRTLDNAQIGCGSGVFVSGLFAWWTRPQR